MVWLGLIWFGRFTCLKKLAEKYWRGINSMGKDLARKIGGEKTGGENTDGEKTGGEKTGWEKTSGENI